MTGQGSTRRGPESARGWPTSATGWTPWVARWRSTPRPGRAPGCVPWCRRARSLLPKDAVELLPRLAWSLAALTLLLVTADVIVAAQAVSLTSETAVAVHGFPFVDGAGLGSALMGALIISRYPRHPIGWLLIATGLSTSISLLSEAYAYWVLESDGPGTREMGRVCAWLAQLFGGQVVVALIAFLFLLAPDGRFVSRRWRYVALVPALGALLCLVAILTVDPRHFDLLNSGDRFGPA